MKNLLKISALTLPLLFASNIAFAKGDYNDVPVLDKQYLGCLTYAANKWEGGEEKSPIPGQSKAEAFCECMWNETPEDFKGSLGKFADTAKGASTNKTCEKYADWAG
ncbi:MAG: hypothetical protein PHC99_01680 [Methylococcales bacterium]|nr:hypothetical protein [Methylococcales bacterium]